jgi:hypothetical protein
LWKQLRLNVNFIDESIKDSYILLVSSQLNNLVLSDNNIRLISSENVDKMNSDIALSSSLSSSSSCPSYSNSLTCHICKDDPSLLPSSISTNNGLNSIKLWRCNNCQILSHLICSARIGSSNKLIPASIMCDGCNSMWNWIDVVRLSFFSISKIYEDSDSDISQDDDEDNDNDGFDFTQDDDDGVSDNNDIYNLSENNYKNHIIDLV